MQTEEIVNDMVDELINSAFTKKLVVFNDEVNSFDYVQECFVKYLQHTPEQALQCAILIDSKGKYSVKEGTFEELEPYKTALNDAGLTCEIQ